MGIFISGCVNDVSHIATANCERFTLRYLIYFGKHCGYFYISTCKIITLSK